VVVMVLSAPEGITRQDKGICREIADARRGAVLAVNKWDLMPGTREEDFRRVLGQDLAFFSFAPVLFVSARTGRNVSKVLAEALAVGERLDLEMKTPLLNRVVHDAQEEPGWGGSGGRRLRVYYGAQVARRPPRLRLFCNNPGLATRRQEVFLTRRLREHFPLEGVPVVLEFVGRG